MAGFWTHDGTDWKRVKQPSGYQNGQWKDAKAAWVYDASASDWVQVWTGAVEIPLTDGSESVVGGTFNLGTVFSNSQFSGQQPARIVFVVPTGVTLVGPAVAGLGTKSTIVSTTNDISGNGPFFSWGPELVLKVESGANVYGRGGSGGRGASIEQTTVSADDPEDVTVDAPLPSDGFLNSAAGGTAINAIDFPLTIDSQGTVAGGGGGGGGGASVAFMFFDTVNAVSVGAGGGGGGGGRPGFLFDNGNAFSLRNGGGGSPGSSIDLLGVIDREAEEGVDSNANFSGSGGLGASVSSDRASLVIVGGAGGAGGDLGQPGDSGAGAGESGQSDNVERGPFVGAAATGGSAGLAIDGASNVTFINRGTIIGSEVN